MTPRRRKANRDLPPNLYVDGAFFRYRRPTVRECWNCNEINHPESFRRDIRPF